MTTIYLAGRYTRLTELQHYRDDLQAIGYVVTSRWLNGDHQAQDADLMQHVRLARQFAEEDLADLQQADWCISFTEDPRSTHSRGGRHVEFGMAHALGKTLIVVGPPENVFHTLPGVKRFWHWEQALEALRQHAAVAP